MLVRAAAVLIALVVSLFATRATAHHHIGCANNTKTTESVTGRIRQIDWENPHVHIHLDSVAAVDAGDWIVEMQAAYILLREGLPRTAFNVGDTIQVVLWRAKDGGRQGFTKSITLNDGRTFAFNIAELQCPS